MVSDVGDCARAATTAKAKLNNRETATAKDFDFKTALIFEVLR
jgi:hypothetical protein